jgi:C4-dicarboxylate-specific signal transduction histidine kinase
MRRFVLAPVEEPRAAPSGLRWRSAARRRAESLTSSATSSAASTRWPDGPGLQRDARARGRARPSRRAAEAAITQRRLAATGELAAGVAHEINNPLEVS